MDRKNVLALPKKIYVASTGYSYTHLGRLFLRQAMAVKEKVIGTAMTIKEKVLGIKAEAERRIRMRMVQTMVILAASRGENFVDSGVKILIAVVIGALLLGGLYALFGDTILPTLTNKVKEMFNFKG